jgi:hypothetical protein
MAVGALFQLPYHSNTQSRSTAKLAYLLEMTVVRLIPVTIEPSRLAATSRADFAGSRVRVKVRWESMRLGPFLVFVLGCTSPSSPSGPLFGDRIRDGASFDDVSASEGGGEGGEPIDGGESQDSGQRDGERG